MYFIISLFLSIFCLQDNYTNPKDIKYYHYFNLYLGSSEHLVNNECQFKRNLLFITDLAAKDDSVKYWLSKLPKTANLKEIDNSIQFEYAANESLGIVFTLKTLSFTELSRKTKKILICSNCLKSIKIVEKIYSKINFYNANIYKPVQFNFLSSFNKIQSDENFLILFTSNEEVITIKVNYKPKNVFLKYFFKESSELYFVAFHNGSMIFMERDLKQYIDLKDIGDDYEIDCKHLKAITEHSELSNIKDIKNEKFFRNEFPSYYKKGLKGYVVDEFQRLICYLPEQSEKLLEKIFKYLNKPNDIKIKLKAIENGFNLFIYKPLVKNKEFTNFYTDYQKNLEFNNNYLSNIFKKEINTTKSNKGILVIKKVITQKEILKIIEKFFAKFYTSDLNYDIYLYNGYEKMHVSIKLDRFDIQNNLNRKKSYTINFNINEMNNLLKFFRNIIFEQNENFKILDKIEYKNKLLGNLEIIEILNEIEEFDGNFNNKSFEIFNTFENIKSLNNIKYKNQSLNNQEIVETLNEIEKIDISLNNKNLEDLNVQKDVKILDDAKYKSFFNQEKIETFSQIENLNDSLGNKNFEDDKISYKVEDFNNSLVNKGSEETVNLKAFKEFFEYINISLEFKNLEIKESEESDIFEDALEFFENSKDSTKISNIKNSLKNKDSEKSDVFEDAIEYFESSENFYKAEYVETFCGFNNSEEENDISECAYIPFVPQNNKNEIPTKSDSEKLDSNIKKPDKLPKNDFEQKLNNDFKEPNESLKDDSKKFNNFCKNSDDDFKEPTKPPKNYFKKKEYTKNKFQREDSSKKSSSEKKEVNKNSQDHKDNSKDFEQNDENNKNIEKKRKVVIKVITVSVVLFSCFGLAFYYYSKNT